MHRVNRKRSVVGAFALTLAACSANGTVGEEYGAGDGGAAGGGTGGSAAVGAGGGTGGVIDPNDGDAAIGPEAGCGYAMIPTEREPGSLLLVVDRSASMDRNPDDQDTQFGEDSKWDLAQQGVSSVLDGLPDDVAIGLLMYPKSGDGCNVDDTPQVQIAPLGITRAAIKTGMGGLPWGDTPTDKALMSAYNQLQAIPGSGNRGIVLVTDGAWNCGSNDDTVYGLVEDAYVNKGIMTFAIGIPGAADGALSHMAWLGGGAKSPTCNGKAPDYMHPFQREDCEAVSGAECCHHVIDSGSYVADLTAALSEVASRFLTSCVFMVPKGDPSQFDPNLVNVFIDGEILPQNADEGWTYAGGGTDALEVHGTTCDELLSGQADTVEIQLGCATYVK